MQQLNEVKTTTTTIALTWMDIKRNGAITTRDQSMDLNSAKMIIQFGHPVDSKYSLLLLLLSSLLLCNAVVVAAVMLSQSVSQSAVQLRMWTKDPYSNLIGAQRHHRARINPLYWGNWWWTVVVLKKSIHHCIVRKRHCSLID